MRRQLAIHNSQFTIQHSSLTIQLTTLAYLWAFVNRQEVCARHHGVLADVGSPLQRPTAPLALPGGPRQGQEFRTRLSVHENGNKRIPGSLSPPDS